MAKKLSQFGDVNKINKGDYIPILVTTENGFENKKIEVNDLLDSLSSSISYPTGGTSGDTSGYTELYSLITGETQNRISGDTELYSLITGHTHDYSTKLDEDVVSMFSIGGISQQEIIPSGTTFTQFVKDLLTSVFNPTFVSPTSSLSATNIVGVNGAAYEAGSENNLTLTVSFNRGSILGSLVNNIWQPNTQQNPRSGIVTKYTINGVDNNLTTNAVISRVLTNGVNTFTSSVDFSQGPQPLNSIGGNFSTPLSAGSQNQSTSITAYVPQWYGVSLVSDINTYLKCADLTKSISNSTAFSISFSPISQYVYFITRNANAIIKDGNLFTQSVSSLNVEDGVSEFYKKSFTITLLDGSATTLYSYRTRTVKTLTSFNYSIT